MPRKAKKLKDYGKASSKKPKRARGRKASSGESAAAGIGHNLTSVKKAIGGFYNRYAAILDEKESVTAGYMSDCRVLIEDAANDLGCSKRLVRMALQSRRRQDKEEAKEREMEGADVDTLDMLKAALGVFGDTPLGQAALNRKAESEPEQTDIETAIEDTATVEEAASASESNVVEMNQPAAA